MHIAILLCGVADPRRPLVRPASGNWLDLIESPTTPFKLSPFDEAALEVALKLRDRNPGARISTFITDGARDIAMMRAVAAFRPDYIAGIRTPADRRGDPAWIANAVPAALASRDLPAIDLWLMGREHGDLDDGVVPAYAAQSWQLPFVGLALSVRGADGGWECDRVSGNRVQTIRVKGACLASITNDKGNRLRHPLMKNVMLAKQHAIDMLDPGTIQTRTGENVAQRVAIDPVDSGRRNAQSCEFLQGSTQEQARALAALLCTGPASVKEE